MSLLGITSESSIDESIGCPDIGVGLFEIECNPRNQTMNICINELCRTAKFDFIDFEYSFVYGTNNATKSALSNECNTWAAQVGQDSLNATAWCWKMDLDDSCEMTYSNDDQSTNPSYTFYWHPNNELEVTEFSSVPLSCYAEEFETEAELSISSPDTIVEVAEELDFSSLVTLKIKMDPTNESPRILTDMTSSPALSDYQEVTSAEIADHMELVLEEVDDSGAFKNYAMSVNQCWASKTPEENEYDPLKYLDQVLLWDEFCPRFPWVGPLWKTEERKKRSIEENVDQYLGEYWLGSDGIKRIHFRQFAWTTSGDTIYYHCVIKVCSIDEESICATTKLKTSAPTFCEAQTYDTPRDSTSERKRRDANNGSGDLTAKLTVPSITQNICLEMGGCLSDEGHVCYPCM